VKKQLSPARAWWKWWWRQQRIIRRETTKAWMDAMIFGTGFTQVSPDIPDGIRHIPCDQVKIMTNG
jgi:hypothetical protein